MQTRASSFGGAASGIGILIANFGTILIFSDSLPRDWQLALFAAYLIALSGCAIACIARPKSSDKPLLVAVTLLALLFSIIGFADPLYAPGLALALALGGLTLAISPLFLGWGESRFHWLGRRSDESD